MRRLGWAALVVVAAALALATAAPSAAEHCVDPLESDPCVSSGTTTTTTTEPPTTTTTEPSTTTTTEPPTTTTVVVGDYETTVLLVGFAGFALGAVVARVVVPAAVRAAGRA